MAVHSDGTGTSWEEAAPDVDQAHGLDWRELQDIKKGVRKRISQEHTTFADNTVGGLHKPGGCAILDIVDQTIDISIDDDTYKGRNIIYDQTGSSLWCFTNTDGTASTPDGYRMMWGPKSICAGGDYTWSGGHLFTTAEVSATPSGVADIANKDYVDTRRAYIKLVDSKATTTDGGTFTAGDWRKRTVTEETDTGSNVSVAASVFVLAAGTYECLISCPAQQVGYHQTRLRNTTGGSTILVGSSERAASGAAAVTRSFIKGRFTIAGAQNVEIQHRCQTTFADVGLGQANSFGEVEIYTIAEFWKI